MTDLQVRSEVVRQVATAAEQLRSNLGSLDTEVAQMLGLELDRDLGGTQEAPRHRAHPASAPNLPDLQQV